MDSLTESDGLLTGDESGFGSGLRVHDIDGDGLPETVGEPVDGDLIFLGLACEPCVPYPAEEAALDPAFPRRPADDPLA